MTPHFKSFLLEYLTDEQRERFKDVQMTKKARSATDHFFGKDSDVVHGQLSGGHQHEKSETHKSVEDHIGKEIPHTDYRANTTKDKYGRSVKISKAIKDDKLRERFNADTTRSLGRQEHKTFTTSTHRGVEVAGQTNSTPDENHPNGHSWGEYSCKNVDNGSNRHFLPDEIKHGTVVHFVKDQHGKEIYRASLHPHYSDKGHVAYHIGAEYGDQHPDFKKSARDTAAALSNQKHTSGVFVRHSKVYPDNMHTHTLHPKASDEDTIAALKGDDHRFAQSVLRQNPNITPKHIDAALDSKNDMVREDAIQHPDASHANIEKALGDESGHVRAYAGMHPKATAEHGLAAIRSMEGVAHNKDLRIASVIKGNENLTPEHLDKFKGDKSHDIIRAVYAHPNATSEQRHHIIDHNTYEYNYNDFARSGHNEGDHLVKMASKSRNFETHYTIANHPNLSSDHIHALLKDKNFVAKGSLEDNKNFNSSHYDTMIDHAPEYASRNIPKMDAKHLHKVIGAASSPYDDAQAMHNKNFGPAHIHTMLDKGTVHGATDVLDHPKVDSTHIDKALDHKQPKVRMKAVTHPLFGERHVDKALADPRLRTTAISHKAASSDHIHKALDSEDHELAVAAMSNPNINADHITKAIKHPDRVVRMLGVMHEKANEGHIQHAENSGDKDMVTAAGIARSRISNGYHNK